MPQGADLSLKKVCSKAANNMKILSYVRGFPGNDDYQRDYSQILIELTRQGHEVTVITLAFEDEYPLDIGNVNLIRFRADKLSSQSRIRRVAAWLGSLKKATKYISDNAENYNIFFGVGWWNICNHLFMRIALNRKLGGVFSVWDSFNPYSLDRNKNAVLKRTLLHLLKWSYIFGRKPILKFYSRQESENAVRNGFTWPLQIATLGIYTNYGDTPSNRLPDHLATRIPKGWRLLFFNARLDINRKGIDFFIRGFIRAMQRLGSDMRIMLVVSGREPSGPLRGQRDLLEQLMQPVMQGGHGILLGDISDQERRDLLANCDMFLYPSRNDGPPRPVRQAISYGTPVMVTYETGIGLHAELHHAGIVIREISDSAAEAAIETFNLMTDQDLNRMRLATQRMAESLQWPLVAEDYAAIFRLAIAQASNA